MQTFFIGCTHFDHKAIIRLAERPFDSLTEMNEKLIDNWNETVRPQDEIFILGDIAYWKSNATASFWLQYVNGQKHIILGNHDSPDEFIIGDASIQSVRNYADIVKQDRRLILFHYPIEDWDGRYSGSIHLHCHTHQKEFRRPSLPYIRESGLTEIGEKTSDRGLPDRFPKSIHCNRFNVTVEATNYTPVSIEEIIKESETE